MATWNSSDNFPGIYWISYLFTKLPSPTSTLCSNRRHTICSLTHLSSDTETDSREVLNIYQLVSLNHNHTYISSTIHHDFRNRPHQPPNPSGYIRPSRGFLRDHPRTHLSAGTGAPEGNNSMVLKRAIFQKGHTSLIFNRFDIGSSGQQVHISFGATDPEANRHPCFKLSSPEELEELKASIYDHHVRGGAAAPMAADKPGDVNSGKRFL